MTDDNSRVTAKCGHCWQEIVIPTACGCCSKCGWITFLDGTTMEKPVVEFHDCHKDDGEHHALWLAQYHKERRTLRYWWHWLRGHKSMTEWMFVKCPDCNGTGKRIQ